MTDKTIYDHRRSTKLLIKKVGRRAYEVDVPAWPGSPSIGRGATMKEALGEWLINNQNNLNLFIDVDPSAQGAEDARRRRELAKR